MPRGARPSRGRDAAPSRSDPSRRAQARRRLRGAGPRHRAHHALPARPVLPRHPAGSPARASDSPGRSNRRLALQAAPSLLRHARRSAPGNPARTGLRHVPQSVGHAGTSASAPGRRGPRTLPCRVTARVEISKAGPGGFPQGDRIRNFTVLDYLDRRRFRSLWSDSRRLMNAAIAKFDRGASNAIALGFPLAELGAEPQPCLPPFLRTPEGRPPHSPSPAQGCAMTPCGAGLPGMPRRGCNHPVLIDPACRRGSAGPRRCAHAGAGPRGHCPGSTFRPTPRRGRRAAARGTGGFRTGRR